MRIWDVPTGYLSRQRLLGEHRELHGLVNILTFGKQGYARHPETLRWVGCRAALCRRHDLLAAEMTLRGYVDRTPVGMPGGRLRWPTVFITPPGEQYSLLRAKYAARESGRVPLPRNAQELWAQHKYSVMARDYELYRTLGRRVARMRRGASFAELAGELIDVLRIAPPRGRWLNAVEHMWGYVSGSAMADERRLAERSPTGLLAMTQVLALRLPSPYLVASTALSELAATSPFRCERGRPRPSGGSSRPTA